MGHFALLITFIIKYEFGSDKKKYVRWSVAYEKL